MKMSKYLKDKEGKWSLLKVIPIGTVIASLLVFSATTAYKRYAWMRDQCYVVDTHKAALVETKKYLENQVGVLHGRMSKETDKREAGDQRLLDIIIKILEQQQKQVEIQQQGLEKQEQFLQEQRAK